jgi:hypothetical protein
VDARLAQPRLLPSRLFGKSTEIALENEVIGVSGM